METYQVKIYPTAAQDLSDIVDYLNTLSPTVALKTYDDLVEEISSLSRFPYRCPRPRDLALAARGSRYLFAGNYLVFDVVQDKSGQIRRILYAKGNYQALL